MAVKKIITVVGATGQQGNGLVRAILDDPTGRFSARALTRDVNSDKAKELARLGAEVVACDVNSPESLKRAFAGAYGAYCVTFFWEHFSPEKELAQATEMARAAKANNLTHVIWSTLEDTRRWVPLSDNRMPTLMERYKVPHFDAKGEADQFFAQRGVPTTYPLTSFYWENFIFFGMGPKKGPDVKLAFRIAAHAADIAKGVTGALDKDIQMARARKALDWEGQIKLSVDPGLAGQLRSSSTPADSDVCTMCGDFCAIKLMSNKDRWSLLDQE